MADTIDTREWLAAEKACSRIWAHAMLPSAYRFRKGKPNQATRVTTTGRDPSRDGESRG